MRTAVTILSFMIISISCTKELDIDFPDHKSQLTLNCVITAGENIRASLTSTLPYEAVGMSPYYKDVLITLYENGQLVDTLQLCESRYRQSENDTTWIFCTGYPTVVGNTYSCKAERKGFTAVHGATIMPEKGVITNILSFEDEENTIPYEITLHDVEGDNFYILYLIYEDPIIGVELAELTSVDPIVNLYANYGIFRLPTDETVGSKAYFTDTYFSGKSKKLKFRAYFPSGNEANGLVLYSVSKEYYDYALSREINSAAGENPFAEPSRIVSNVKNGFGLVGAINVTYIRF